MANRLLRSPQYITATGGVGTLSAKLTITIDGILRYTLIKEASSSTPTLFEWAELARDYLDITLTTGVPSTQPTFTIGLALSFWDALNAGGSQVGSTISQSHYGFDGYGSFYEAANPEMSATEFPAISNYSQVVGGTKTYTVYAPKDISLRIPSILNGTIVYNPSGFNATDMLINGTTININRIECTKYASDSANNGYTETSLNGIIMFLLKCYCLKKYG